MSERTNEEKCCDQVITNEAESKLWELADLLYDTGSIIKNMLRYRRSLLNVDYEADLAAKILNQHIEPNTSDYRLAEANRVFLAALSCTGCAKFMDLQASVNQALKDANKAV